MKSAIEVLNEVHHAGKENPNLYEAVKVNDGVFVAAIVGLANQLERFNQTKQDKITPAQVQALANDLTRGALSHRVSRVLAEAGVNEKEVALKIYQFLESL
ncbi:MAG: hypothetical protein LAO19_13175 [Acidobacteriia bacterium]|nr:hypothetical protein [Terriglobia bacterium]